MDRLLTVSDVMEIFQVSRTTVYRNVRDGFFPEPIRVGRRGVRWRESDLRTWIHNQEPVPANETEAVV